MLPTENYNFLTPSARCRGPPDEPLGSPPALAWDFPSLDVAAHVLLIVLLGGPINRKQGSPKLIGFNNSI